MLGKPIPKKMREEMANDVYYCQCARYDALHDHECMADPMTGKLIEWEHALTYRGSKLNEIFAIVPICWWAHRGPGMVKEINEWLALNRISDEELEAKYQRTNWVQKKRYLNSKYGIPNLSTTKAPF